MRETLRRELRMPDGYFLEILDAPQIAVHADGAQVKTRNAERLAANLAIPTIEPPEVQIRRSIRQTSRLDGIDIVNQKQEHVAVAGIKRRGVLGDVHKWIMRHAVPIEHARHLPPRISGPVACDFHDGCDKFVIPDTPVVRPSDRAKLDATVIGLQCFHQLGAV